MLKHRGRAHDLRDSIPGRAVGRTAISRHGIRTLSLSPRCRHPWTQPPKLHVPTPAQHFAPKGQGCGRKSMLRHFAAICAGVIPSTIVRLHPEIPLTASEPVLCVFSLIHGHSAFSCWRAMQQSPRSYEASLICTPIEHTDEHIL